MSRQPQARARPDPGRTAAPDQLREELLSARLLILAPHMDDETLACGGTVLLHRTPADVYCLFATDGADSPAPLLPWQPPPGDGLVAQRHSEALAATRMLGIPGQNLRFLDLPDGSLHRRQHELFRALQDSLAQIRPAIVLAPFRFDVHPDHVALNRAARRALANCSPAPRLLEYFVYYRIRFLPGGDVRRAVPDGVLLPVDTSAVAQAKMAAIEAYVSQTTRQFPWQEAPVLARDSLERRCLEPEYFLPADPAAPPLAGLGPHARRIRLATVAMRLGKRPKDRALGLWRWALRR